MKALTEGSVLCNGLIDGGRCEYQNDGSSGDVPLHQARLKQINPRVRDVGMQESLGVNS